MPPTYTGATFFVSYKPTESRWLVVVDVDTVVGPIFFENKFIFKIVTVPRATAFFFFLQSRENEGNIGENAVELDAPKPFGTERGGFADLT